MQKRNPNAWIAIDHGLSVDLTLAPYTLRLKGERSLYQAIADDDWVLILDATGNITRVGRVLRVRSDLETTTIYFDRMLLVDPAVSIGLTSLTPPSSGSVGRVQWTDFLESLPKALHKTIAEVPIESTCRYVAQTANAALTMLYWHVGQRIRREVLKDQRAEYGEQIVSTLSTQLVREYGKGFAEKSLRRMMQFAEVKNIVATLSRELSWSHFILTTRREGRES